MATTVSPETTPLDNDGSLAAAAQAIHGLLSGTPEKKTIEDTPPEQASEKTTAPTSKQAPTAPAEAAEGEPAQSDEASESSPAEAEQPQTFKISVDGEEIEVTLDEALKGYSRTQDYTRKTQAIAEARKKFEAEEVAAVRAERAQYQSMLTEFETALKALNPVEPDWGKLKAELPPEQFAAEVLAWQTRKNNLDKIQAEKARVQAQQDADAQQGFQAHVTAEREKLHAKIPDLKDPEKSKALMANLVEFATVGLGYSPEDVQRVTDHRLVVLLHKAFLHDQAEKAAPKIKNKIEQGLNTTPPGPKPKPVKTDELTAAKKRLTNSHSLDDAAAAIRHLL